MLLSFFIKLLSRVSRQTAVNITSLGQELATARGGAQETLSFKEAGGEGRSVRTLTLQKCAELSEKRAPR